MNEIKYIAKKDTCFKEGSECELVRGYKYNGFYRGVKVVDKNNDAYAAFYKEGGYKNGDEVEIIIFCPHDDFILKRESGLKYLLDK